MQTQREEIKAFFDKEIAPLSQEFDMTGEIPDEVIRRIAAKGYLGTSISPEYGGLGYDQTVCAFLYESAGRACSSVRTLITVHLSLVAETIQHCGIEEQKTKWLPMLSSGKLLAAFGLSEPLAGSDPQNMQSSYIKDSNGYLLNGVKTWVSFAQTADLFLIFARGENGISAFLVPSETEGLTIESINNMLGTKASKIGKIHLKNCHVPLNSLLGAEGMGFLYIANMALDNGRFSVTLGTLGLAKAALNEGLNYLSERKVAGKTLKDYDLIKAGIGQMAVELRGAELLCYEAAKLRQDRDDKANIQTMMAKLLTTTVATKITTEIMHLHGAVGLTEEHPSQRFFRDATVMEIIEGTTELQQLMIGNQFFIEGFRLFQG